MTDDSGIIEHLEREFDIDIERRLRTAVFVKALYAKRGVEITETQALELLRDPSFLEMMISVLLNFGEENGIPESPDLQLEELNRLISSIKEKEEEE